MRPVRLRGALLLVAFLATVDGCVILPRRAFPKTRGSVEVSGLEAPVEVIRDSYGVAHLYAHSAEDLYFAQGYVHAQERFYQMEFQRRVGAGRLSELFGEKTLETDIFLRTMGFAEVARQEYRMMSPRAKASLDAYVAGVNAYLEGQKPGKISLEYALLKLTGTDFEIEPWTPEDSITWAKMMSWSMSRNFSTERLIAELLRTAGIGGVEGYFAPYRDDMPYVLDQDDSVLHDMPRRFFAGTENAVGSNAWVIDGSRSAGGNAMLANDTHLGIQQPSIWYEIGMHTVDDAGEPVTRGEAALQVRGFSFPGYPGVIIGHNDSVAWGITDYGDDVQDLYFEKINPLDPNQYQADGRWVDMELRHERIDIQGDREPFVLVVRSTRHGPIITDQGGYKALESYGYNLEAPFPEGFELYAAALQWTALMPGELWECFFRLQGARDFDDFRDAWSHFDGPILNIVYADAGGNIGYQIAGHIPIRPLGDGRIPVPGWSSEYDWQGFVPFEELPSVLNPSKGYVVTANNPAVGEAYPYDLGTTHSYGYRARRISELIEDDSDGITMEDAKAIQGDTYDQAAVETVAYLRGLNLAAPAESPYLEVRPSLDRKEQRRREETDEALEANLEAARQRLLEWDGHTDVDSTEAAIYGFFLVALWEETFQDQYPRERWAAQRMGGREFNAVYALLQDAENPWWDDVRTPDIREARDEILVRAFRKGLRRGIETLGEDLEDWTWGDVHTAEFRNATLGESGVGWVERLFNVGPAPVPGSITTVYASAWDKNGPFNVVHLTTNRWIVDLGNLEAGLMIHAPGQSGHAKHRHYDDFVDTWAAGEYHPSNWSREDVEADRSGRMMLVPGG